MLEAQLYGFDQPARPARCQRLTRCRGKPPPAAALQLSQGRSCGQRNRGLPLIEAIVGRLLEALLQRSLMQARNLRCKLAPLSFRHSGEVDDNLLKRGLATRMVCLGTVVLDGPQQSFQLLNALLSKSGHALSFSPLLLIITASTCLQGPDSPPVRACQTQVQWKSTPSRRTRWAISSLLTVASIRPLRTALTVTAPAA